MPGADLICLRVVSIPERKELPHLELVEASSRWYGYSHIHPGEIGSEVVLSADSSPFELTQSDSGSVVPYWIRAKGYAWKCIEINHSVGGTMVVTLDREARLNVELAGEVSSCWFRLRRITEPEREDPSRHYQPPALELPLNGRESLELDGLASGLYLASVELGDWLYPTVCAEPSVVMLNAGATAGLKVELISSEASSNKCELHGTLCMDSSWGNEPPALVIGPSRGSRLPPDTRYIVFPSFMGRDDERNGVYKWIVELSAGSYQVGFPDWGIIERVNISAPVEEVSLVLGKLKTVSVETVTQESSEVADVRDLYFSKVPVVESEVEKWTRRWHKAANMHTGMFEVRAPCGMVELAVRYGSFRLSSATVRLEESSELFQIMVRKCGEVSVGCTEGGRRRPINGHIEISITSVEDNNKAFNFMVHWNEGREILALDPGRYLLSFPVLECYEPVEPVEICVELGDFKVVDFELTRSR